MKRLSSFVIFFILTFLSLVLISTPANAQTSTDSPIGIEDPLPGQAVQGLVQIEGFINLDEFDTYTLSFSFTGQDSWFPITTNGTEVRQGLLAEWDTSAITDGNYDLVLTVSLPNGESLEFFTKGVRVRNYSIIETDTPHPTQEEQISTQSPTATSTPIPTQRSQMSAPPLPKNDASFSTVDIQSALIRGGIFGIILFGLLTILLKRKKYQ